MMASAGARHRAFDRPARWQQNLDPLRLTLFDFPTIFVVYCLLEEFNSLYNFVAAVASGRTDALAGF